MSGVRSQQADLLREAEEKLRASVGAERDAVAAQAAILNALPAHIALDRRGRRDPDGQRVLAALRRANALLGVDAGVGQQLPRHLRPRPRPLCRGSTHRRRRHPPGVARARRRNSPSSIPATRRPSAGGSTSRSPPLREDRRRAPSSCTSTSPNASWQRTPCARATRNSICWRTTSPTRSGSVRRTCARCATSVRPSRGSGAAPGQRLVESAAVGRLHRAGGPSSACCAPSRRSRRTHPVWTSSIASCGPMARSAGFGPGAFRSGTPPAN